MQMTLAERFSRGRVLRSAILYAIVGTLIRGAILLGRGASLQDVWAGGLVVATIIFTGYSLFGILIGAIVRRRGSD